MPELVEARIMSEFVDQHLEHDPIVAIHQNAKSKIITQTVEGFPRDAIALGFGKETLITMVSMPFVSGQHYHMRVQYGMTGHWIVSDVKFGHKHSLLSLELQSGKFLEFVDPRRFGKWTIKKGSLGPSKPYQADPTHDDFVKHLLKCKDVQKYARKRINELMLDQNVFFGIGNYLRAEILDRMNFSPFTKFGDLTTIQILRLVVTTRHVLEEAYEKGGGKLMSWKNPLRDDVPNASEWLQCYKKKNSCVDGTKRRFWYDEKWMGDVSYH